MEENVYLRGTTLTSIDADDGRQLEIIATCFVVENGIPMKYGASVVSPLHVDGMP